MLLYGDLTYKIRAAIFEVYNYWGPGLFEQIYEESLVHQLRKEGLKVEQQVPLPVIYDGVKLPCDYRLDLLVEDKVIIELKSVEELHPVHYKHQEVTIQCAGADMAPRQYTDSRQRVDRWELGRHRGLA